MDHIIPRICDSIGPLQNGNYTWKLNNRYKFNIELVFGLDLVKKTANQFPLLITTLLKRYCNRFLTIKKKEQINSHQYQMSWWTKSLELVIFLLVSCYILLMFVLKYPMNIVDKLLMMISQLTHCLTTSQTMRIWLMSSMYPTKFLYHIV